MLCRIVIQVDFVENFTTKMNCLDKSVYWAYNQDTFCTACVWKHGGTHSIVIVSDYLQCGKKCCECLPQKTFYNISIQLSTSFRKLSYFQLVLQVNLNWAYSCLALHSLEEMVCIHLFAASHCKGPVGGIGATMRRLVSHEVM